MGVMSSALQGAPQAVIGAISSAMAFFTKRRFLPLFITQFFNALNDSLFKGGILLLTAYELPRFALTFGNAAFFAAIASSIFILPYFLFSATAGEFADKYDKAKLAVICKASEVFFMLLAFIGFYYNSISTLFFLLFCMGCQSTFFGPIKYAIPPQHLAKVELMQANAYIEAATFVAILCGTAGSVIVLQSNGLLRLTAVLISFSLIGLAASLFIPPARGGNPNLAIRKNFLASTLSVCGIILKDRILTRYLLLISWFWALGSVILTQMPNYAETVFSADGYVVITCLAIFSIGIGIGAVGVAKFSGGVPNIHYILFGGALMSLGLAALYFSGRNFPEFVDYINISLFLAQPKGVIALASMFIIALGGGVFVTPLYTLFQTESKPELLARGIAVMNIFNSFFMAAITLSTAVIFILGFNVKNIFLLLFILNTIVILTLRALCRKMTR
jgi:acyl-[acyl-carrier-protein]-phospholipid O-acyltransferase/long-chain-fatty-acid--[acyl-carrier-protein] ligase